MLKFTLTAVRQEPHGTPANPSHTETRHRPDTRPTEARHPAAPEQRRPSRELPCWPLYALWKA